jgi:perosamine synthetase
MTEKQPVCDEALILAQGENIVLFYPHIPSGAAERVSQTLATRWIGQGPQVDRFETEFARHLGLKQPAIATGAGTDALHLAYVLAGLQAGDEVIVPVFTCTATNIPLLYHDIEIRFADIQRDTMNLDVDSIRSLITSKTKAIVCVHYGGLPCDMDEILELADQHGIVVIEDAAHSVGAKYKGRPVGDISPYTMFSFQAIKHLTTGDGGMLFVPDEETAEKARRLRWFGIDRAAKQGGYWSNDIVDVGYKYQMTDIAAAIGLAGLDELSDVLSIRRRLFNAYVEQLSDIPDLQLIGANYDDREHAAWLFTVAVERRQALIEKLRSLGIESGRVHFRNDRYTIFKEFARAGDYPNMDYLDDRYLILPLHTKLTEQDVKRVCDAIRAGW